MKKWLIVGGVVMLCVWAPFFYAELTSSPSEKKGRALPTDEPGQEVSAIEQAAPAEGADKAAEPSPEPTAKPTEQAKPQAIAAADKPATPEPNLPPAARAGVADPTAAEGDGQPDDEPEPPAPPPTAGGPTTVLKHAFETQPRDPLWAADTEAHMRSLFRGGDIPAELLQSASCRTAVCKLELRWTSDRATAFVSLYETVHKDFQGEVGIEPIGPPDDKGQEQVNLYLTRKGYTVADLTK
jgi:hypothetical protein